MAVSVRFDSNETVIVNNLSVHALSRNRSCDCPEISHFVPKYFWTMHEQDAGVE